VSRPPTRAFYVTNDTFCVKNNLASGVRQKQASPTCHTRQGGSLSGMRRLSATKRFADESCLAPNRRSSRLPKSPSNREVRGAAGSILGFRPHAIIVTERSIPSPIFVAALIGVEKILRIDSIHRCLRRPMSIRLWHKFLSRPSPLGGRLG